jgi:hypothetical protein
MQSTEFALTPLEPPTPGEGVFEPYTAIDQEDPRRAAAVAVYPTEGRGLGNDVWCWRTTDGGGSWQGSRVTQAKFDGEGAADPLVAYGADGALLSVAMAMPRMHIDARIQEFKGLTRENAPTVDERMEDHAAELKDERFPVEDMISVSRSDDHGETWSATIIPNSGAGDKTAIAVDTVADSPQRGNVYVAWCDTASIEVAFARSTDGGRTFDPAIRLGDRSAFSMVQVAVGVGGAVHLVWSPSLWRNPDVESDVTQAGIFHARSDDGGATFGAPRVVARHGLTSPRGLETLGALDLAASPTGALLAAWSAADDLPAERGSQVRNTVRWIHSADGVEWSEPAVLADLPADTSQGLPAVASTDDAWYVLTYDAGPDSTTVRLYSARHDDREFRPVQDLATRGVGADDLYLHGNYVLRSARDILIVGDYVGLAGTGTTLATTIVLPENDDWHSTLRAYAAITETTI